MSQEDKRNRYTRRDNEGQPKIMGPLGKALLLILLIWACWVIYNFTDDRNQAAEDLVENQERLKEDGYKWRYKDVTNTAGEYNLKEKGLFGKVIKIPLQHEIVITGYCNDAAKVEMKFLYYLKEDMTTDELLYYQNNKGTIEQGLKVAIRNALIEYSILDFFEGDAAGVIRKTANNYAKYFNLNVVFTTFTPK